MLYTGDSRYKASTLPHTYFILPITEHAMSEYATRSTILQHAQVHSYVNSSPKDK